MKIEPCNAARVTYFFGARPVWVWPPRTFFNLWQPLIIVIARAARAMTKPRLAGQSVFLEIPLLWICILMFGVSEDTTRSIFSN